MMATRRLGRTHHEFRFGRRELVVIGAVFCLIASLLFAAGIVVGREMTRGKGAARADATREHRLTEPEGLRGGEAPAKTAATRAEEKVTFYRTLTAPTQDLPQVGKPTIEERLVPKEEPPPAVAAPAAEIAPEPARAVPEPLRPAPETPQIAPEASRAAPERRTPKAAEVGPAPRPARAARAPAVAPARPAPPQLAAATTTAEPEAWTVQVSAFRSRSLAEESAAAARGPGLRRVRLPLDHRGRPAPVPGPGRRVPGPERRGAGRRRAPQRAGAQPPGDAAHHPVAPRALGNPARPHPRRGPHRARRRAGSADPGRLRWADADAGRGAQGRGGLPGRSDAGDRRALRVRLHRALVVRGLDALVRDRRADQGSLGADRGPRRPHRRGHRGHGPDPRLPPAEPRDPAARDPPGLHAPRQGGAPGGARLARLRRVPRFPTSSSSATGSTSPGSTGTCRTWASWTPPMPGRPDA